MEMKAKASVEILLTKLRTENLRSEEYRIEQDNNLF